MKKVYKAPIMECTDFISEEYLLQTSGITGNINGEDELGWGGVDEDGTGVPEAKYRGIWYEDGLW